MAGDATVTWDEFAAQVAEVARVAHEEISEGTRLIEDLDLDSLALTELVVILVDKYDMFSLAESLDERNWEDVPVRALYTEYLSSRPPRSPTSSRS